VKVVPLYKIDTTMDLISTGTQGIDTSSQIIDLFLYHHSFPKFLKNYFLID